MPKKYLPLILLMVIGLNVSAQHDTTYYYIKSDGYYTVKKDSADIIRMVIKPSGDEKFYTVHDIYRNGNDKLISHSIKSDASVLIGYTIEFFPNGKKKSDETFYENALVDQMSAYYPNGKLFFTGNVNSNNVLIVGQCRDTIGNILAENGKGEKLEYDDDFSNITGRGQIENGVKADRWLYFRNNKLWYSIVYNQGAMMSGIGYDSVGKEHPFKALSEAAVYNNNTEGLLEFIKRKIRYTDEAKKKGIKGTVHLSFTVEKDGKLTNIKVTSGLGYGLDEDAVRVMQLTSSSWLPAKQYGLTVSAKYDIPVNFGLDNFHSSFSLKSN